MRIAEVGFEDPPPIDNRLFRKAYACVIINSRQFYMLVGSFDPNILLIIDSEPTNIHNRIIDLTWPWCRISCREQCASVGTQLSVQILRKAVESRPAGVQRCHATGILIRPVADVVLGLPSTADRKCHMTWMTHRSRAERISPKHDLDHFRHLQLVVRSLASP